MANFHNDDYKNAKNTNVNTQRASGMPNSVNNFTPSSSNDNALLQTSTNIFVYANGGIVGMIQSFRVSESRGINKLQAIGYEGVVQAVPSNTNGGQLDISRFALYSSNLWAALGLTTTGLTGSAGVGSKIHTTGLDGTSYDRGTTNAVTAFRTLKDQRVPLEIKVKTPIKGDSTTTFYEETYVDCWLQSYSKAYNVGTITVTENATITYSDVF